MNTSFSPFILLLLPMLTAAEPWWDRTEKCRECTLKVVRHYSWAGLTQTDTSYYDHLNRLIRKTVSDSLGILRHTFRYKYEALRLKQTTQFNHLENDTNQLVYEYNDENREVRTQHIRNGIKRGGLSVSKYDSLGRCILVIDEMSGFTESTIYDNHGNPYSITHRGADGGYNENLTHEYGNDSQLSKTLAVRCTGNMDAHSCDTTVTEYSYAGANLKKRTTSGSAPRGYDATVHRYKYDDKSRQTMVKWIYKSAQDSAVGGKIESAYY